MTTNELIEQARQLLIASPRGGRVDLEGLPYRELVPFLDDPEWDKTITGNGTLMLWNATIEDDLGVHIGEITLNSEEKAKRSGAWILPDGTEYSS